MSRTGKSPIAIVSIIIPCYNAQAYVSDAISSALAQSYEPKEIVVVDDGSTDGTLERVKAFGERISTVEIPHSGGCAARNAGLRHSGGTYIKWLDADDLLVGDFLGAQAQACESGCDVVYGDWEEHELVDGHWRTTAVEVAPLPEDVLGGLIGGAWCPPHCYLMKRTCLEAVGGWDERLTCMQDVDLTLRLALGGFSFHHVPGLCAIRRKRSNGSVSMRDPVEFSKHILRVVGRIEDELRRRNELNEERVRALLASYQGLPSAFVDVDGEAFEEVFSRIERLNPRYVPTHKPSRLFRWWGRLFSYRSAELWAARKRRIARALGLHDFAGP